jgi:hypothetical protein
VRSVEFHADAQDEFVSAAQFYESERAGSASTSSARFSGRTNGSSSSRPVVSRLVANSGEFWYRSFPTVFCIASSLTESTSSRSCTFTGGPDTGGPGAETLLTNSRLERSGSTPAAQLERYTAEPVNSEDV